MDKGAWWVTVYGTVKRWTELSDWHYPWGLRGVVWRWGQRSILKPGLGAERPGLAAGAPLGLCLLYIWSSQPTWDACPGLSLQTAAQNDRWKHVTNRLGAKIPDGSGDEVYLLNALPQGIFKASWFTSVSSVYSQVPHLYPIAIFSCDPVRPTEERRNQHPAALALLQAQFGGFHMVFILPPITLWGR